ncbi:MAG: histidinol-phosphatase [Planctomycetota bacterium]|nr:MAG: histidinol-phosphatase [Planctomycetota bacterium]
MRSAPALVVSVVLALAGAVAAHDRAIEFPDVPGYRTLVVDLHIHSVFSDGSVWPDIRVEESQRDGVDLMAVTEHLEYQPHKHDIPHPDRNRSFELAHKHAGGDKAELIVVNGAEITRSMPEGHVNAVFLSDANALLADDAEAAYTAAKAQNAFVFWNHPSWTGQRKDGVAVLSDTQRSLIERDMLHGIEVANGAMYSQDALQMALDHDLAILGTSDIHGLIDWDYDVHAGEHRTVTLVFAAERSADSAREALHANRTVAWMNNTLIGRDDVLLPLLEASLQVASVNTRDNDELVHVTLVNHSDASFELANRGDHNFYGQAGLIRVPPHSEVKLGLAGETRKEFALEFEVLNAVNAPGKHPRLSLEIEVP